MEDFISEQRSLSERDERENIANAVSVLNATHSPLLRLPGELRNKIYTFLCRPPFTIELRGTHYDFRNTLRHYALFRPSVALSQVSRLLHHETSALNFTPMAVHCDTILALDYLMLSTSAAQRNRVIELQLPAITDQPRIVEDFLGHCRRSKYVFHEFFPRVVRVEFEEAILTPYDRAERARVRAKVRAKIRKLIEKWMRKDVRGEIEFLRRRK